MKRCPHCLEANPDSGTRCTRCGQALPAAVSESLGWREWLDPESAFKALRAGVLLLCLYALLFGWTFTQPLSVLRLLANHVILGLGLGLGVGAVQGLKPKGPWAWIFMGLLAGMGSFTVDFLYNYQHLVYRLVFFIADWVDPWHSVIFPFQLLQALRFGAACLVLSLALYKREGSLGVWLWRLACVIAACFSRAMVRGWPMDPGVMLNPPFSGAAFSGAPGLADVQRFFHLSLYFLSLWLVLYGFGRRPFGVGGRHFSP